MYREGKHFFTTENQLEVRIAHFSIPSRPRFPYLGFAPLDLQVLQNLRVNVDLAPFIHLGPAMGFGWRAFCELTALNMIQVAITLTRHYRSDQFLIEEAGGEWKNSFIVAGFVKSIVEAVPARISLKWGSWDSLTRELSAAQEPMFFLTAELLAEIEEEYQHMRGRQSWMASRSTS